MAKVVFANNASSLLAASINAAAVVIQVGSGDGALFPSPTGGDYFVAALLNSAGDLELVKCTSRTGDLLTVVRGQEGTSAASWTNGATRVELRLTKGTMEAMFQKTGDTMTGDLDMDGNDINNARIDEPVVTGGQLVGTAIRGAEDDASNELAVPADGSRATAGGSPILTQEDGVMESMPIGAIIMWFGSLGSLPTGWQQCDGSNGTPNMIGAFPRGAGVGGPSIGASGGASTASGSTSAGGAHTPTGDVAPHALSVDEMPSHRHRLLASSGGGISASGTITDGHGLLADYSVGHSVGAYQNAPSGHASNPWMEATGGDGAHDHGLTMDAVAAHTHTIDSVSTIPPYKAVYFIMKVS